MEPTAGALDIQHRIGNSRRPWSQTSLSLQRWESIVLSLLRFVVGLLLLEHGTLKLFHFPSPDHRMGMHGLTPLLTVAAWLTTGVALVEAYQVGN